MHWDARFLPIIRALLLAFVIAAGVEREEIDMRHLWDGTLYFAAFTWLVEAHGWCMVSRELLPCVLLSL